MKEGSFCFDGHKTSERCSFPKKQCVFGVSPSDKVICIEVCEDTERGNPD